MTPARSGRICKTMAIAVVTLLISACSPSGQRSSAQLPPDYEIEDIRKLPQDMQPYASFCSPAPLGTTCRDSFLAVFMQQYFSPWGECAPPADIAGAVRIMQEHGQKEWYGENKRKVPPACLAELLANCDLAHFPSMKKAAIATAPTAMRVLPTARPLFGKADDFPFDALQNTELKMNEPLRVRHVSADGLWVFVESSDTSGWVEAADIGYMDESLSRKWREQAQLVIVRDATLIRDKSGVVGQKVKVGTIFPIAGEDGDAYEIDVAINSDGNRIRTVKARVPKGAGQSFPLAFSRDTVALVGNELIGKPYGWGEMFRNRDCSAMIRDFYMPFGIWLPRGSYNQINAGRHISLAGLNPNEKERLLREKGVPFLTLVYLKGHIMLYVGHVNNRALVFHSIWGVSVKNGGGSPSKQVIGKAIVSTLTPGSELDLAGGSLLERADSMLILTDCCGG